MPTEVIKKGNGVRNRWISHRCERHFFFYSWILWVRKYQNIAIVSYLCNGNHARSLFFIVAVMLQREWVYGVFGNDLRLSGAIYGSGVYYALFLTLGNLVNFESVKEHGNSRCSWVCNHQTGGIPFYIGYAEGVFTYWRGLLGCSFWLIGHY